MAELGSRSKSPCYPWYPGDLRRDTGVRACCFYAVSVWREMLDAMHDGEPYGHFAAGGVPITAEELARMIGEPVKKVRAAIAELELRNVFSRTEVGVIYSRRMVRDDEMRRKRAAGGELGGNPKLKGGYNKPGCVYVALRDSDGAVKIGISQYPPKRLYKIRQQYPGVDIKIIDSVQVNDMGTVEARLHAELAAYSINRSEWFRLPPDVLHQIVPLAVHLKGNGKGESQGDLNPAIAVAVAVASAVTETDKERTLSGSKEKEASRKKGSDYSPEFLAFWAEYPPRAGNADKVGAWKKWQARLKAGVQPEALTAGAKRYAMFCFDTGKLRTEHVLQAQTFLGSENEHWAQSWTSPPKRGVVPPAASVNERPQSQGERSDGWFSAGGQKLETQDERDDRRVAEWRTANPDKALVIWQECVNEIAEMLPGNRGQFTEVAARAMVSSKFRARVIAEHLTPRLSA